MQVLVWMVTERVGTAGKRDVCSAGLVDGRMQVNGAYTKHRARGPSVRRFASFRDRQLETGIWAEVMTTLEARFDRAHGPALT